MKNQEIKFKDKLDSYSVFIGNNTLNILPHQIKKLCPKTKKIALIVDKKIPNKFKKILKRKLKNYNVFLFSFSSNEKMKSLKTVDSYLKKLLSKNFNRSDLVIGVGGGIIIIPLLMILLGMTQHQAQGTSIAVMLPPIGILAAWNYHKAGFVDWKYALIISVAFIVGSYLSSKWAVNVDAKTLKKVFGIMLLFGGFKLIFGK